MDAQLCTRLVSQRLINHNCLNFGMVPCPTDDALLTTAFRLRRSIGAKLASLRALLETKDYRLPSPSQTRLVKQSLNARSKKTQAPLLWLLKSSFEFLRKREVHRAIVHGVIITRSKFTF